MRTRLNIGLGLVVVAATATSPALGERGDSARATVSIRIVASAGARTHRALQVCSRCGNPETPTAVPGQLSLMGPPHGSVSIQLPQSALVQFLHGKRRLAVDRFAHDGGPIPKLNSAGRLELAVTASPVSGAPSTGSGGFVVAIAYP